MALVVVGQFAYDNGNGLVVNSVTTCKLLSYVQQFGPCLECRIFTKRLGVAGKAERWKVKAGVFICRVI